VVCSDLYWVSGSFQEMPLLFQYTDDSEHLFVVDLIVPFHWRQKFAVESHWIPFFFSRMSHSWTSATLTGSITILFFKMTSLRYSIYFRWNSHFSEWRNNLYSVSISKTLQTAHSCSSFVFVKIKMSSKYTMTIPSAMTVLKTLFIIVWKVAVKGAKGNLAVTSK